VTAPIGAVLAGGRGRRIGGQKATVELDGHPLVAYPVATLSAVVEEVVLVVKNGTVVPELGAALAAVWTEPDELHHPVAGIVHALRAANGRPVLIAAGDRPLLTPEIAGLFARADPTDAPAVIASVAGRPEPLLGLYTPAALPGLARYGPGDATGEVVLALGPRLIEVDDEDAFLSVKAPEDVLRASALLAART
jgi:molybdopterin-guanine dinucleotide biosynthesis protein A